MATTRGTTMRTTTTTRRRRRTTTRNATTTTKTTRRSATTTKAVEDEENANAWDEGVVNGDDAVGANAYGGEIFHLERTAYEAYGEETARGGAAAYEEETAEGDDDVNARLFVAGGMSAYGGASEDKSTTAAYATNGNSSYESPKTVAQAAAEIEAGEEDAPYYAEMAAAEKAQQKAYAPMAAMKPPVDDEEEDYEIPGIHASPTQGWTGGGFDTPEGTIALPLSYYQILGLTAARSTPNALPRAALAVMDAQLTEGYSPYMLEQRLSLIDEAVAVLKDEEARRQHDDDIAEGILTPVEPHRAAAALCLLQEAGEYEAVLEFEHVVAQCVSGRRHRRDVALTVALALCEYGHMALVANPPRFAEGCELLDMGSKTLSSVAGSSFAPEVRRNIALSYHDVAPGYVLELLASPLEARSERALGLRALRSLLWTKDPAQQLEQRAAFMEQANELLTAQEQMSLFIDAPDYIALDSDEVYKSALAHVVAGVIDRKPMMIADADEILHQIQLASLESADISHFADVGVERAVCQILLGQLDEAEHTLGLRDDTVDPGLLQYIEDRSPSGDIAEGMCSMADQWLVDVAFPLFRGSNARGTPTLDEWFSTPSVQGFVGRMSSIPVLIRIQGAIEAAKRVVVSSVDSVVTAFAPTPPALQFGVSDAQRRVVAVAKLGVFAGIAFAVSGRTGNVSAPKLPTLNPLAPLQAAVGTAGSTISKLKMPTLNMPKMDVKTPRRELGPPTRVAPKPRPTPAVTMDKGTAEKLVRKWQMAKAQAMGQRHNTRYLDGILDGPMLQQWKTRAEDVATHGWAWEYKLNDLSIDSVQVIGTEKVFVETTLTEVAVLKDRARNEPDDVYESTYRAKYELKRCETGKNAWRIVGGSVVY